MKVINEFKPMFDSNAKYLIVKGDMGIGKFYAACQKAVFICLLDHHIRFSIFCPYKEYAERILKRILENIMNKPEETCKFDIVSKSFIFTNHSRIDILGERDIDQMLSYHGVIIQSADGVLFELFNKINKQVTGQIILTCNSINAGHWLWELSHNEACVNIDLKSSH